MTKMINVAATRALCYVAASVSVWLGTACVYGDTFSHTAVSTNAGRMMPQLSISAEPGGAFRTVDLRVTLTDTGEYPRIYYLALSQGRSAPKVQQIDAYLNGRETDGLTDGTVVRGRWVASAPYEDTVFSLTGGENVTKVPGETGFIDGYRYDIYVLAVNTDGIHSLTAVARDVMAQPFDAVGRDAHTYTIRTARQLANIQRLADLYIGTKGIHGSEAYLVGGYTYILGADIDLREYSTKGSSWTPIGNADANGKHIFKGTLDGNGHHITGLFMDKESGVDGQSYRLQGLFGKMEDSAVLNLTLDTIKLRVFGDFGRNVCAVGALAGEMLGGSVSQVTVKNASITAYGADEGNGDIGIVLGRVTDTQLQGVTVTGSSVSGYENEACYAESTGGIAGRYSATKEGRIIQGIITDGTVRGYPANTGVYAGGVIGFMEVSGASGRLHAEKINISGTITGGGKTGGLAGMLHVAVNGDAGEGAEVESTVGGSKAIEAAIGETKDMEAARLGVKTIEAVTFDTCRFMGRVTGGGDTGGLFGEACSDYGSTLLIKNAVSGGQVAHDGGNGAVGGLAGILMGAVVENVLSCGEAIGNNPSYKAIIENNLPYVTAIAHEITHRTADTPVYHKNNRNNPRQILNENTVTGGLVGIAEDAAFMECFSQRSVFGLNRSGGFVGEAIRCEFQTCGVEGESVTGLHETGGFAGRVSESGKLYTCYSHAAVSGETLTGGFAGSVWGEALLANTGHAIDLRRCYAAGDVTSSGGQTGGFAGSLSYAHVNECRASGDVRANAAEAGGFSGRISHMSRVSNAYATGDVVNTGAAAGGFTGLVTHASCVEFSYAAGDVTGYDGTGGFAGVIAAYGAPNTLTNSISFAQRVSGPSLTSEENTRRFVGCANHAGINDCYAYLGGVVLVHGEVSVVTPGAFGVDGGDVNAHTLSEVLTRLGWEESIWDFKTEDALPVFNPF